MIKIDNLVNQIFRLCNTMNVEFNNFKVYSRGFGFSRNIRFLKKKNSKTNYNDKLNILFVGNENGIRLDQNFNNEFIKIIRDPFPRIKKGI